MRLRVGAASDVGRIRPLNEDAFEVCPKESLFVVCDGMGGAAAGEVASQLAVKTIVEELTGNGPEALAAGGPDAHGYLPRTSLLADAVRLSNRRIYDHAQTDPSHAGMGTTLVSVWIGENVASLAHVGDSRAYLWRDQRLDPLTRDHSLVEEQVRLGMLAREDSLQSIDQNVLLRALGPEPEVDVEVDEVPVQPGDFLLLCTDGLTRMVPDAALADVIARLRDPERICRNLIDTANDYGGPDNITVVVIEVQGSRLRDRWNRWT
jgi:serine/threonine protein phosphatase PrpC